MSPHLFVYGTLRKAQDDSQHAFLKDQAVFIDNASLPGRLYQVSTYPGAVLTPISTNHVVKGEVYRLLRPRLLLQQLDDYEECARHFPKPHEYLRKQANVTLINGSVLPAWVYVYQQPVNRLPLIESGDYAYLLPETHHPL